MKTSGKDTHTTCSERYLWREGVTLLSSGLHGLAGYSSQKVEASLTWTGGHTTGESERERNTTEPPNPNDNWTKTYCCASFSLLNSHCSD